VNLRETECETGGLARDNIQRQVGCKYCNRPFGLYTPGMREWLINEL